MDKTLMIDLQHEGEQHILHLTGRIDTLGARELDEFIRQLPQQPQLMLILDLGQVSFLSSAGIRILIKYYKQCRETKGDFTLLHVPPQATGVLKMVGLEQLILNGDQEAENSILEYEYQNLRFRYHILHRETARLICSQQPADGPFALHPYDLLIGKSQKHEEFIAVNNTLLSEETPGPFVPLYYLGMHGLPSHYIEFETKENQSTAFSELITHLLQLCEAECAGIILFTQSTGITGITLQSEQPQLTRYPAYSGYATLIAGIAHLNNDPLLNSYTRTLGIPDSLSGHFHATVYSGQPAFSKETDFPKAFQQFTENLRTVKTFHLINDNRIPTGNGENRFSRGCAWILKNK